MPTPAPSTIEHDPRWARVLARDASADGQFVYAVKTTGVYCQPSSPSRLPRPENVEFFDTPAEAEAAGYRPSRRATPDQTTARDGDALACLDRQARQGQHWLLLGV
ncbi:Ada metal-binding domain-containing protein, partial [Ralstonia pseudosolanacearum]|uniref:Ada metal-binding domain-containing protein n=1 Tax=Ralstonia pseudosolanacearum TaxID=1310165 RepID=UPI003CF7D763